MVHKIWIGMKVWCCWKWLPCACVDKRFNQTCIISRHANLGTLGLPRGQSPFNVKNFHLLSAVCRHAYHSTETPRVWSTLSLASLSIDWLVLNVRVVSSGYAFAHRMLNHFAIAFTTRKWWRVRWRNNVATSASRFRLSKSNLLCSSLHGGSYGKEG